MANDFSEQECMALWNFESGALIADSKGANTLTNKNTTPETTTDVKQGAACALPAHASDQGFYVTDANLAAGFPFKLGDAGKIISVCGWFKSNSQQSAVIFGKWGTDTTSWLISQNYNSWSIGTSGGGWQQYLGSINNGTWYHVAFTINGVTGAYKLRIWDGTTSTNYTGTGTAAASNGAFCIGNGDWANSGFDGRIDEVVVFNRILSDVEIDDIRDGTYAPPEILLVQIDQAGVVTVYDLTPSVQASQAGIAVVYSDQEEEGRARVNQSGLVVVYNDLPDALRKFPVPSQKWRAQTQFGKRVFPAVK